MSRRRLTPEEKALWKTVARTADPLPGRGGAEEPEDAPPEPSPPPAPPKSPVPRSRQAGPKPTPLPAPKLAPLEKRLVTRLARGTSAIDARIDLHGLTQRDAHQRLQRFLAEAQARDDRTVLVITGKGRAEAGLGEERGVLRRVVPMWLAEPAIRRLIVGFEEAHVSHGGAGALYVRLRRKGRVKAG